MKNSNNIAILLIIAIGILSMVLHIILVKVVVNADLPLWVKFLLVK